MNVWRRLHPRRAPLRRAVATLGVFDGVHVGHQRLMRLAAARARALRGRSVAVTFDPHPQHVLRPATARPLLTTLALRLRLMARQGIDVAWVVPFTRAFSRRGPAYFFERVLRRHLALREVVVGERFAFGHDRLGTVAWLQAAGARAGIVVHAVPAVSVGGLPVSSSRVCRAVEAGDVRAVRRLLRRPHIMRGTVVRGRARGGRLGFPTANLRLPSQILPPPGVYAVRVTLAGGAKRWHGVLNVGTRPTFRETRLLAEVHLFGHPGRLYGSTLDVEVVARLRQERRFPDAAALAAQIARDVRRAHALLRR